MHASIHVYSCDMYEFADTQFYSMVYHTIYHYDMAGTKFDTLYVSVLNPVVYQLADIKFCCMNAYEIDDAKSCCMLIMR